MGEELENDFYLEAIKGDLEVKSVVAELVDSIKKNRASVFMTGRFENKAKIVMSSEAGSVNFVRSDGMGGFTDIPLFNGASLLDKCWLYGSGSSGRARGAENVDLLISKGILRSDGSLVDDEKLRPLLITLDTRKGILKDKKNIAINGYCLLSAESNAKGGAMNDMTPGRNLHTTMTFIIPTEMGEKIVEVIQKKGPAAAYAILFDSVGYKLKHGSDTDYAVPKVDLNNRESLGVAFKKDKVEARKTVWQRMGLNR